jgi:hypothetical protein
MNDHGSRAGTAKSSYQLVMVFLGEGSPLRLLELETPVRWEERVLFGPVKMQQAPSSP